MSRKKGQSAAPAAVLIIVIMALLILYIVALPPDERIKILEGESNTSYQNGDSDLNDTLLRELPGRIDYLSEVNIDHAIPSSIISAVSRQVPILEKEGLEVSKSLFTSKEENLTFSVPDLQNTKNGKLAFTVQSSSGRLTIKINDLVVFDRHITQLNIGPIDIPDSLLKETNTITFRSSSPGMQFWKTNRHTITSLFLTADVKDVEAQSSSNIFLVSTQEKQNLGSAALYYQPDCDTDSVGSLRIWINENNIFNGVPDCSVRVIKLEVPPEIIRKGKNTIEFSTTKGKYELNHIRLNSKLDQIDFPVYYFELTKEQFERVEDDEENVLLGLKFVDLSEDKEGKVFVNGRIIGFDTREEEIELDISSKVVRGNNAIKIKPDSTIEIRELVVWLD